MFAIEEESTEKAITEWQKIQKLAPENDTVLYFGGIVYFNDNQIQKAEKYFKRNRQIQSTYNDRSLYFIAMIDWKRNKREEAKKKFQQLKTSTDLVLKKAAKSRIEEIDNTSE
jgi:tetratricopeptide (TPR) repeat protein